MAAKALTIEEAKAAKLSVIEDNRGASAVHEVVTAMRANRRSGTANTKTRGEVSHSNKKPWRQKGTGRARAGRTSSPIWRGGGVVFGPKPRDYSRNINKATRRLAFRKALSARIQAGDVLQVKSFSIADGKTKSFEKELLSITDEARVLIIGQAFDEATTRAEANHPFGLLMTAEEVNTEHLLYFDKIVVVEDALPALAARTAEKPKVAPKLKEVAAAE